MVFSAHPLFDPYIEAYKNDVALIYLDRCVDLGPRVGVATIASDEGARAPCREG